MGRYTTVQAYSDNNPNMRSVAYDQVTGANKVAEGGTAKSGSVKPEKVVNPYSSTAGAGSGEFHVYRHARAREIARLESLDRAEEEELAEQEFQTKISANEKQDRERTDKRRKKRQREKEAKRRKKALADNGLLAMGKSVEDNVVVNDDEFEYTPMRKQNTKEQSTMRSNGVLESSLEDTKLSATAAAASESSSSSNNDSSGEAPIVDSIPNDGSFLETMLKRMKKDGEIGISASGADGKVVTAQNA
mmetsp:Transcript_16387/g.24165  ORF Transcript_16387/g.24165 Transcript_16387/m.24165 type:complete len:247 (-) Transcript_16387:383-1123(-)|eukprot:CAMPEP_0116003744 /NCGR_PEP_ID=MMETSP0321-20121206/216_1 /TAXON_ID=163516 /ORGANISM="Leptocylindrus danicus var. danicus, Strain B650" /LENGTH=246 /DNA_ID=CAMNT_0003471967 /DNA_START=2857 /DNA_END=3597 /DNA_ORIENTATION=+